MLKSKSFLAVDFGAGSLKLAEFEVNEAGGLRLKQYAHQVAGRRRRAGNHARSDDSQGAAGAAGREGHQGQGRQCLRARVSTSSPSSSSCRRWMPARSRRSSSTRRSRTCRSRWQEVVWDYQILGSTPGGELEVLLVAIKADIVEGLVPRDGGGRAAPATGRCFAGGAVQRVSLQLRRSGRLHDAAGHRRQDQQPAVLREGQGLFPQHQPGRQLHHPGFRQRSRS